MTRGRHRPPRRHTGVILLLVLIAAVMVAGTVAVACVERKQEAELPVRNHNTAEAEAQRPEPEVEGESTADAEPHEFRWPTDIGWESVAGIELPLSVSEGPHHRDLGRATGFGQTPAGAVLAALHLLVRTSYQVGPAVWAPTLRDQVVGPDKAAYAAAVRTGYDAAIARGEPVDRIYAAIAGVRVDAVSAEAASLRVLIEAPTGTGTARAAAMVQMSWADGDWRLIAPPRGSWSTVRTPVPAPAVSAYTPLPAR